MLFPRIFTAALTLSGALFFTGAVRAQEEPDPFDVPGVESVKPPEAATAPAGKPVKATLEAEQNAIVPGQTFTLAVHLTHDEHWHTYWRNSGNPAQPTTFTWTLPEGVKEGDSVWPVPTIVKSDFGIQHVLTGDIYILTNFTAPATLKPGDKVEIKTKAGWLQCKEDQCVPGGEDLAITLTVAEKAEKIADKAAAFDAVRKVQPVPVDAWKVSVEAKDKEWIIKATPADEAKAGTDLGNLYFFDAATAIANDPQDWQTEAGAKVLKIKKASPDSEDKPWGYIQAEKSWLKEGKVTLLPAGETPAAPSVSREDPSAEDGAADAGAKGGVDEAIASIRSWGIRPMGGVEDTEKTTGWGAILLAFLGGMILNLMPCVFPVLGIKILGFVRQSGEDKAVVRKHGLVYAGGVIVSILTLAGVLLIVRQGSASAGWGFQLENPLFLAFLIVLVYVFSLNMAGVFEVGTSLTGVGAELQDKSGYKGSFFSGLLTVLLATPCTGPFMAPALGFALSGDTPIWLVLAVFASLAIGLALPYVVLSWFPALIRKLPRPGAWMETFKQFMSFPMFATAVWLLTVFVSATGETGMAYMLFALVLIALALWLYGRFGTPAAKPRSKKIGLTFAVLSIAGGGWMVWAAAHEQAPEAVSSFSPQAIIKRREQGLTTVVDVGATWCLQCQTNKKAAFDTKEFRDKLPEYDASFMYADKTRTNVVADKFLKAYEQSGIPFAVVIPPKGPVIQLPSIIVSPSTVIEALEEAKKQGAAK